MSNGRINGTRVIELYSLCLPTDFYSVLFHKYIVCRVLTQIFIDKYLCCREAQRLAYISSLSKLLYPHGMLAKRKTGCSLKSLFSLKGGDPIKAVNSKYQ